MDNFRLIQNLAWAQKAGRLRARHDQDRFFLVKHLKNFFKKKDWTSRHKEFFTLSYLLYENTSSRLLLLKSCLRRQELFVDIFGSGPLHHPDGELEGLSFSDAHKLFYASHESLESQRDQLVKEMHMLRFITEYTHHISFEKNPHHTIHSLRGLFSSIKKRSLAKLACRIDDKVTEIDISQYEHVLSLVNKDIHNEKKEAHKTSHLAKKLIHQIRKSSFALGGGSLRLINNLEANPEMNKKFVSYCFYAYIILYVAWIGFGAGNIPNFLGNNMHSIMDLLTTITGKIPRKAMGLDW